MECSEANVKKVKACLSNMIEKEESILEFATVQLSICSPYTGKKFRYFIKEGILCVIINRNTSCLFLKLFEFIEFNKVFEIELYTNISDGYTVRDNYFHIIEFPGFFLGLTFPTIENPNVTNRGSLIQKSIISTSKFISINLSDYIYYHKFDYDKSSSKKISKTKTYNKKGSIIFRPQNVNINSNKEEKEKDKQKKLSKKDDSGNLEMLSNKVKFSANLDGQIDLKENNIKNNNEFDSMKKSKSSFVVFSNNHKRSDSASSKSNSSEESHSITVSDKNNAFENQNYYKERESFYTNSKDKQRQGILKKSTSSNLDNKLDHQNTNKIEQEKPQIIIESREKMIFEMISIGDSADTKVYKICQYHILKDKMKLIKKLFKKNFHRFINPDKVSFEKIREYKINTYDFINDDDYSSEEDDGKKTFVDYVPANDMIGFLENQDIQDERLLELMQQKKNLKEISKKKEDGIPMRTTAIYD